MDVFCFFKLFFLLRIDCLFIKTVLGPHPSINSCHDDNCEQFCNTFIFIRCFQCKYLVSLKRVASFENGGAHDGFIFVNSDTTGSVCSNLRADNLISNLQTLNTGSSNTQC